MLSLILSRVVTPGKAALSQVISRKSPAYKAAVDAARTISEIVAIEGAARRILKVVS